MITEYETWTAKVGYSVPEGARIGPYLLFYGQTYYPCEGLGDLAASGDTIDELVELALKKKGAGGQGDCYAWWHVVEHATLRTVEEEDHYWEARR